MSSLSDKEKLIMGLLSGSVFAAYGLFFSSLIISYEIKNFLYGYGFLTDGVMLIFFLGMMILGIVVGEYSFNKFKK